MFPVLARVISRYVPFITLPFAALIGVIGYNLENILSDKYTPYQDSISQKRRQRLLEENGVSIIDGKVLERNLSPSLKENKK